MSKMSKKLEREHDQIRYERERNLLKKTRPGKKKIRSMMNRLSIEEMQSMNKLIKNKQLIQDKVENMSQEDREKLISELTINGTNKENTEKPEILNVKE